MNANDADVYHRPALALCSSEECTNLLLDHGADPNLQAPSEGVVAFARDYIKVYFLGIIADKTDQLRQIKYSKMLGEAEMAERFSIVMATVRLELRQAYRRSLCTSSPLLEALAEGKLAKAEALILAGAQPAVELPDFLNQMVDFSDTIPERSAQYKRFEQAFGRYVWKEISMKLLQFGHFTFSVEGKRGSDLVQSAYARERMFKGLNLPQHKDCERRLAEMVTKLQKAELDFFDEFDDSTGAPEAEYPSVEDLESCKHRASSLLKSLNANPAARLLEEAVISNKPGAKIHVSTEDPVSEVGRERPKSRIASEYYECLKVGVEATDTSEDQAAAQVSQVETLARRSRTESVVSTISNQEGWGEYRNRLTKSWHVTARAHLPKK